MTEGREYPMLQCFNALAVRAWKADYIDDHYHIHYLSKINVQGLLAFQACEFLHTFSVEHKHL